MYLTPPSGGDTPPQTPTTQDRHGTCPGRNCSSHTRGHAHGSSHDRDRHAAHCDGLPTPWCGRWHTHRLVPPIGLRNPLGSAHITADGYSPVASHATDRQWRCVCIPLSRTSRLLDAMMGSASRTVHNADPTQPMSHGAWWHASCSATQCHTRENKSGPSRWLLRAAAHRSSCNGGRPTWHPPADDVQQCGHPPCTSENRTLFGVFLDVRW